MFAPLDSHLLASNSGYIYILKSKSAEYSKESSEESALEGTTIKLSTSSGWSISNCCILLVLGLKVNTNLSEDFIG